METTKAGGKMTDAIYRLQETQSFLRRLLTTDRLLSEALSGQVQALAEKNQLVLDERKPTTQYQCRECGGTDVLVMQWVNPNTGQVSEKTSWTEGLSPYCNKCNDCTTLKTHH
jgi:hypothetical protein